MGTFVLACVLYLICAALIVAEVFIPSGGLKTSAIINKAHAKNRIHASINQLISFLSKILKI